MVNPESGGSGSFGEFLTLFVAESRAIRATRVLRRGAVGDADSWSEGLVVVEGDGREEDVLMGEEGLAHPRVALIDGCVR